jgi:hypothetical protein
MSDLFKEIIPSILQTKENALLTDQDERSYPKFMVGRALSNYADTVLVANELNKYPNLDNKLHYDFCLNIVKPFKRPYAKWFKKVETTDLQTIKEYYGYSDAKAMEILNILTNDQISDLKNKLNKGG